MTLLLSSPCYSSPVAALVPHMLLPCRATPVQAACPAAALQGRPARAPSH